MGKAKTVSLQDIFQDISISEMPGCCAFLLLHDFPDDAESIGDFIYENEFPATPATKELIEENLIRLIFKNQWNNLSANNILITLTDDQIKYFTLSMLRRQGFKRIATRIRNPNTGNNVSIFLRVASTKKK